MGYFFLLALDTDAQSLDLLKNDSAVMAAMTDAMSVCGDKMRLTARRDIIKGMTPSPLPAPVAIAVTDYNSGEQGARFGDFLGFHYDGAPTGTSYAPAPLVQPGQIVFSIDDFHIQDIHKVRQETLVTMIDAFRNNPADYKQELFDRVTNDDQLRAVMNIFHPSFINDTNRPVPLHIFKKHALQPGDDALLKIDTGWPCMMSIKDYDYPLKASQLRAAPASVPAAKTPRAPKSP
jgi:hypothetical protein